MEGYEDHPGPARVHNRKEERLPAHIVLRWLTLLLVRVAAKQTGQTRRNLRHELQRLHLVTLDTDHGTVAQRSLLTPGRRAIQRQPDLPEPPRFYDVRPEAARPSPSSPPEVAVTDAVPALRIPSQHS